MAIGRRASFAAGIGAACLGVSGFVAALADEPKRYDPAIERAVLAIVADRIGAVPDTLRGALDRPARFSDLARTARPAGPRRLLISDAGKDAMSELEKLAILLDDTGERF